VVLVGKRFLCHKTYTDTKVELVINNSGDAAALLYDKDAVDTPVNVIARITQRELINNSVGRFMIPSQVTTTNLPITRFDIDFKILLLVELFVLRFHKNRK
jgi:hypothetical protein